MYHFSKRAPEPESVDCPHCGCSQTLPHHSDGKLCCRNCHFICDIPKNHGRARSWVLPTGLGVGLLLALISVSAFTEHGGEDKATLVVPEDLGVVPVVGVVESGKEPEPVAAIRVSKLEPQPVPLAKEDASKTQQDPAPLKNDPNPTSEQTSSIQDELVQRKWDFEVGEDNSVTSLAIPASSGAERLMLLKEIPSLTTLELIGFQFPGTPANSLFESWPQLRTLHLSYSNISDAQLASVVQLDSIEVLHLEYCRRVSSEGLKALSKLSRVRELHLTATKANDDTLESLKTIGSLNVLSLSRTDITDKGLQHLSKIANLKKLLLYQANVTREAVSVLGMLRPDCLIEGSTKKELFVFEPEEPANASQDE